MKEKKKKTKATQHGATRKVVKPAGRRKFPWKFLLSTLLLGGCGFLLAKVDYEAGYRYVVQSFSRPINSIVIEGSFELASKQKLENIVRGEISSDFVDINLKQLKSKMEEDPWVESVNVKRVWPDSLVLEVHEEKPIARWGDEGFINKNGELVKVKGNSALASLPELYGNDEKSSDIARWYISSSHLLHDLGLTISGIEVNVQGEWSIHIDHGFDILLGSEGKQEKLEAFIRVFNAKLKSEVKKIDSVDLRYKQALAVSWKDSEEWVAAND